MSGRYVGFVLIAVIILGAAGIVFRLISTESATIKLFGDVRTLNSETVDKIVMRDAEQQTIVEKLDRQWWVGKYPALNIRMETLWETVSRISEAQLIATNSINHELMGVHPDNSTVLEFWNSDQLLERFIVGDKQYAPVGERIITPWTGSVRLCYLRRSDQVEVYALFCEFPEPFGTDSSFWKDPIVAAVPPDEIVSITYTYAGEKFSLKLVDSVWFVETEAGSEVARIDTITDLLNEIRQIVTREFPEEEELVELDWNIPHAMMAIEVAEGSSSRSVLLSFLQKGINPEFYVRDMSKSWSYFLNEEDSYSILKTKSDFVIKPSVAPTPYPTSTSGN